jgi:hypothetical protein
LATKKWIPNVSPFFYFLEKSCTFSNKEQS